jgi:hypothetical protein
LKLVLILVIIINNNLEYLDLTGFENLKILQGFETLEELESTYDFGGFGHGLTMVKP